jgi:hypothetical protein
MRDEFSEQGPKKRRWEATGDGVDPGNNDKIGDGLADQVVVCMPWIRKSK